MCFPPWISSEDETRIWSLHLFMHTLTTPSIAVFREQGLLCHCTHWFLKVTLALINIPHAEPPHIILLLLMACSNNPSFVFTHCHQLLFNPRRNFFSVVISTSLIIAVAIFTETPSCCVLEALWPSGQIPENIQLINQRNSPVANPWVSDRCPVSADDLPCSYTHLWGFFRKAFRSWWLLKLENNWLLPWSPPSLSGLLPPGTTTNCD